MEKILKEIYDCQEILNFVTKARTEEELKCDKLFKSPNTIEWLSERKNNLDKEVVKLEEEISKNDKKLVGGYFVDMLKFETNFKANNYDIFCHKKNSKLLDKYISNTHSEIYINHRSCDKSAVIKELIDSYDLCIRENFVVIFLKSLKASPKECGFGPQYMLDAIKEKGMKIKINEESDSLRENKEIFDSSAIEKNSKTLIDGPLLAKMFDSNALEAQKGAFEKEFQMIDSLEQKVTEYCEVDITGQYHQHQEL